jgi:TDG/mug DNA glycosylase family protein
MRTLPDHLRKGMKLVIVGCNPTESSVRVGHYYAGRDNPFWPILFESGVVPEPFDYHDDKRVIEFGIGLTDLVKRPSKTVEELSRADFAEGRRRNRCMARVCTCSRQRPARMGTRRAKNWCISGNWRSW